MPSLTTSQSMDAVVPASKPQKAPAQQKKRWTLRTPRRTPKKSGQSENEGSQVRILLRNHMQTHSKRNIPKMLLSGTYCNLTRIKSDHATILIVTNTEI